MNTTFFKGFSFLVSLATITALSNNHLVQAQTTDTETTSAIAFPTQTPAATAEFPQMNPATQPVPGSFVTNAADLASPSAATFLAQSDRPAPVDPNQPPPSVPDQPGTSSPSTTPLPTQTPPTQRVPGTMTPTPTPTPTETTPPPTVPERRTTPAPLQDVRPGRATRSGSSYVGVGANIGLGDGDTALGETSFAILSKIGMTPNFSVRPTVFIDNDPTILIPVTYDFYPRGVEEVDFAVAPYLGGGIAISVGDDSAVDLLLSAGIDVPLTEQFTATGAVNLTGFDNTAVGLLIGIGYNF